MGAGSAAAGAADTAPAGSGPALPPPAPRWASPAFRRLLRLLGGGADHMAEWRGWVRWTLWYQRRSLKGKGYVAMRALTLPIRAAIDAAGGVRRYGRAAEADGGVGPARQLLDQWRLHVAYGIQIPTYYGCRLYRPDRRSRARGYIDQHDSEILLRRLLRGSVRAHTRPFVNKRAFEPWCAEHGLPAIATLLEIGPADPTASGLADGELPPHDLFTKPANGSGGRGGRRWVHHEPGTYAAGALRLDAAGLLAELRRQAAELRTTILVQESLRNHQDLRDLTNGGLATMRIVTIRPLGGTPALQLAVYRMPVGTLSADNFGGGGVAAPVDLATGRLGPALRRDPALRHIVRPTTTHPDTGAPIEGRQLPHWPETVRTVLRAHAAAQGVAPAIGWDVAILDRGPVIVEGNNVPGSPVSQMVTGIGYGETGFVAMVNAYCRAGIT